MVGNHIFPLLYLLAFEIHACSQLVDASLGCLHERVSAGHFVSIFGVLQHMQAVLNMLFDAVKLEHQTVSVLILLTLGRPFVCAAQMKL
ncbi:hypothetical protein D3C87_1931140 [compost metagenome]